MNSGHLRELERTADELQDQDDLTQADVTQLAEIWRARLSLRETEEEQFDVCDARGHPIGITAPRWLCHLLGLRHRATHVILRSPQNLLLLQVRSPQKAHFPNHIDTSVGGHLRAGQDFHAATVAEMEEELGLPPDDLARWLVKGELQTVGEPYARRDYHAGTPPLRNAQVNQLYAGQLTPAGLAHVHFRDGEVSALYLCPVDEARRLVAAGTRVAPGLADCLPRYLAWYGTN